MSHATLPVLSSSSDNRTFGQRVASIKKRFGLPRWVTSSKKAQPALPLAYRTIVWVEDDSFVSQAIQKNYHPVPNTPNTFVIGGKAPGIKPVVDVDGVISLLTQVDDETVEIVLTKAEETAKNLIALAEVSFLAKPYVLTTKEKITRWIESYGGNGVSVKQIQNAFPEIAASGISSRVSEMVRSGHLVLLGKFADENQNGIVVNFYTGSGN